MQADSSLASLSFYPLNNGVEYFVLNHFSAHSAHPSLQFDVFVQFYCAKYLYKLHVFYCQIRVVMCVVEFRCTFHN